MSNRPPYETSSAPLLQRLPARLALFRALQLGDMLCAVPALRALRTALPDTRITLIGLPWAAQFARRFRHYVDDFIAFPGHPAFPEQVAREAMLSEFYRELQAREFDFALQMHGNGAVSNGVVQSFGAREMGGFAPSGEPTADPQRFLPYPAGGPESLRLLRLVAHLGANHGNAALEFPLTDEDRNELRESGHPATIGGRPYFCIHPGARHRAKCWPPAHFAAVADAIAARFRLLPVLTGSPQETDLTAAVAARMRHAAVDTAGPLSIGAMAALMQGAQLLVCNDTGVSHIAAGLRLPSVVVFNNADMQRWAPLDRRLHRCIRDPHGEHMQLVRSHAFELLAELPVPQADASPRLAMSLE